MRRSGSSDPRLSGANPASGPGSDQLTYAAIISLSLPGAADVITANVVLTASDHVEVGTQVKPLSDCTLNDIREFADKLEQSMWETYQAIKLVDLARGEETNLEVTVKDRAGKTVMLAGWSQQAVLLPATEPAIQEAETNTDEPVVSEETRQNAESGDPVGTAKADDTIAVDPEPSQQDSLELLTVTVSESEPVYAEREAADDPNAFPTPAIAPSRARVRIAGRRLPPGDPTWSAVDILIDEPALRSAQAHALSSPDREVAGVLLGPPPEKQPDGRYVVHVIDTILAKYTVMHGASVTYTPESWRYMHDKLHERYPDETAVIVGWYHTHPGFGIFLSGMDQFIHQNFFTQLWHTALVLDPLARKCGFFTWDRNLTRVGRYRFAWPDWASDAW